MLASASSSSTRNAKVSEREKLIKHLRNLKEHNKAQVATLNIDWLLSVLETEQAAPAPQAPPKPEMPPNEIVLDGGIF